MEAVPLAVQLLAGGFVVLSAVTVLGLVEAGRRDRPVSRQAGASAAALAAPAPVVVPVERPAMDAAVERAALRGLGDARILRCDARGLRVRLYECPGCRSPSSAAADADAQEDGAEAGEAAPALRVRGSRPGCALERLQLEECFFGVRGGPARAREVECRRLGARYCEFDIGLRVVRGAA